MFSKSKTDGRYPLALLNDQVSLQLGRVSCSDNGVSVSIMYS